MQQVLGLIDAIETTLLEQKRMPFSSNLIIPEKKLLLLLSKLRELVLLEDQKQDQAPVPQETRFHETAKPSYPEQEEIDQYALKVLDQLDIVAQRVIRQVEQGRRKIGQPTAQTMSKKAPEHPF